MTEATNFEDDSADWAPCETGEIRRMVDRVRSRRRNRLALTGATAGVLLIAFGLFGAWSAGLFPPTEPTFGGIACSDVRRLGEQYMMGTLDEATARKIRDHLEQCPECPLIFEQMRPAMAADGRTEVTQRPASRSLIVAGIIHQSSPSNGLSVD